MILHSYAQWGVKLLEEMGFHKVQSLNGFGYKYLRYEVGTTRSNVGTNHNLPNLRSFPGLQYLIVSIPDLCTLLTL